MSQKKKILIISRAFYPFNSPRCFRTTELAKELARQGHRVTVLTHHHPSHSDFAQKYNLEIKDLGTPNWRKIKLKGQGIEMLIRRGFRRLSGWLFDYPDLELTFMVAKSLQKEFGYDGVISIAVPHSIHWGVAKKWQKGSQKNPAKVWIADCGDPYMGAENDTFKPPFYFRWVEKWFMRKADYITVPISEAISAYYPEFHHKIKVIPQGFRFEDFKGNTDNNNSDYPIFGYGGMFIPGKRDPTELIRYLANTSNKFEFNIYTNTPIISKNAIPKGDERFQLHKLIPRSEFLKKISAMDFVVNFENLGSKQSPSKLIDYAIVDKPILAIETGNLDEEIVNQFLVGDYSNRVTISNPDQYRIEKVAKQFLDLIIE